jgi:hypothetical protein
MKIARSLLVPFAVAGVVLAGSQVACSSSSSTPDQDPGLTGTGTGGVAAESAPDKNPDGVAYPTANIGTNPRTGKTRGNTIANFKFVGYPDGNVDAGLQPISLASFYDPQGTKYRLIHIQASGSWCTYCRQETEIVTPLAATFKEKKVVWLMSLAEGTAVGTPSSKTDLDRWVKAFSSPFTHLWDAGNQKLGIFYDSAALPWNAQIDARTMEILTATVGATTSKEAVLREIDDALAMTNNAPAQ